MPPAGLPWRTAYPLLLMSRLFRGIKQSVCQKTKSIKQDRQIGRSYLPVLIILYSYHSSSSSSSRYSIFFITVCKKRIQFIPVASKFIHICIDGWVMPAHTLTDYPLFSCTRNVSKHILCIDASVFSFYENRTYE